MNIKSPIENMQCPYCYNTDFDYANSLTVKEQFRYHKCSTCGSYQLENRESIYNDKAKPIYEDSYYTKNGLKKPLTILQGCWAEDSFYCGLTNIFGRICSIVMGTRHKSVEILSQLNLSPNAKILDFGCGNGQLLKMLHSLGFTSLTGVDPITIPEGGVWQDEAVYFNKGPIGISKYDVIISCHSIEHTIDPGIQLVKLLNCVKVEGYLVLQCPITPNLIMDHYLWDWIGWDAPRHLTIPSLQGIYTALNAADIQCRLYPIFNESTMWNVQASQDNADGWINRNPRLTKVKHFVERYIPFRKRPMVRAIWNKIKQAPHGDCVGLVIQRLR